MLSKDLKLVFTCNLVGSFGDGLYAYVLPVYMSNRWVVVPQTVSMFVSFIAPYLGGLLYAFSPEYPFLVAAIVMPDIALLAVRLFRD